MEIPCSTWSNFLEEIEDALLENRDTLLLGTPLTIRFSPKGYNGRIRVNIDRANSATFWADWESPDPTRFPARIKAAASALFRQGCFGEYLISHETGILTIQSLGSINVSKTDEPRNTKVGQTEKPILQEDKLVDIISNIPWDAWQRIVANEPEWQLMQPFLPRYRFGAFAVLMLTTGLNDYQLKGKADEAYWPQICALLEKSKTPESPPELGNLLEPLYQKERLATNKIERLERFLGSSLASNLWESSAQKISAEFLSYWYKLAEVMHQQPQDKTIVFAMKCLGISLLMAGEFQFNFGQIPIPVDSRVEKFTKSLGIQINSTEDIRNFWSKILILLKRKDPRITMIHLDSLIWQIASLDKDELQEYFMDLNPQLGNRLASFSPSKKGINSPTILDPYRANKVEKKDKNNKVICFIPCCKSKDASGEIIKPERILSSRDLPNTWNDLLEGREGMQDIIETDKSKTTAIKLYTGKLYSSLIPYMDDIIESLKSKQFRLIIISAGYGIIDALEPIYIYNAEMKGRTASHWSHKNLQNVIADLLLQEKPTRVYGFFAGERYWSSSASNYRYFFTEGLKTALSKGLDAQLAGCFYRVEGGGYPDFKELKSLGSTFVDLMKSNFTDSYVNDISENCRNYGNVKIGFQKI